MNLSKLTSAIRVSNAVAAGTTDITSSAIDMQGYEGCLIFVLFGTITASAVTSVKAQQSSDDGASDTYADLTGTSITIADDEDNTVAILDIYKPRERYLKCIVDRGTQNAVVDGIFALRYGARVQATTHDATTVPNVETHISPAEGTA